MGEGGNRRRRGLQCVSIVKYLLILVGYVLPNLLLDNSLDLWFTFLSLVWSNALKRLRAIRETHLQISNHLLKHSTFL